MLCMMHVRNFAIIESVEVEFSIGMNVMTGETGAGKSILIDALGLVLGERATTDVIRAGQSRAEIAASFEPGESAQAWLEARALDAGGECHLRRVIAKDGRARGFINGNPATMQSLRELGALLVSIHGQHEHQLLTRSEVQRDLLDTRGDYDTLLTKIETAWHRWREAKEALEQVETASTDDADRAEFLRFQLAELDALGVAEGEFQTLEAERLKLANATSIAERGQSALEALYDGEPTNALALLAAASKAVEGLAEMAPELGEAAELLNAAEANISEAGGLLQRFLSSAEADPARLSEVEQRSDEIRTQARKHRIEPERVFQQAEHLRSALSTIDNAEHEIESLRVALTAASDYYEKLARQLSKSRQRAAKSFGEEVTTDMQTLGMQGGRFRVVIESPIDATPRQHGLDQVRFEVAANPGQPPQPIAKVASGGELSRISLAIQVAAGQRQGVRSMIFDEVDSGVGGGVAEVVGKKMRGLANACQVLAVTHLPQVAGQAHHHLRVSKMTDGKSTKTKIIPLSMDERVEEIARMLGGVEVTGTTRDHAREMLQTAAS
ncbi:MAG: DNA repair protein RecN [Pseudomonadota bacterium]